MAKKKNVEQMLVEKWENMKTKSGKRSPLAIDNIEDYQVKVAMAKLLENQYKGDGELVAINEASQADNTLSTLGGTTDGSSDSDSYKFKPIAMAIVRRAIPEVFAFKACGTQPMNSPVGLAYAIRKVYASNNTDEIEANFDNIDKWAGYTGSTSQTSAVLDSGTDGIYDSSATGAASVSAETWTIEPSGTWPQLEIRIDKKTITALTRKLGTSYSLESAQDLQNMLSIDIEKEMVGFLQQEIVAGLDREILYRLKKAATDTSLEGSTITAVNVSGTNLDGRWSQEKFANIISAIVHQQQQIAVKTRMGQGNFAVVSPSINTALRAAPSGVFTAITNNVGGFNGAMPEVGVLDGSMKVYLDVHARTDYALVGYHGAESKDNGVIYSPYTTGLRRTIAQEDFSPRVGAFHRYAITDNLLGAGRYYRLIPFTNMSTIVPTA